MYLSINRNLIVGVLGAGLLPPALGATLTYDDDNANGFVFQEANWVVTDNTGQPTWTIGADPPANTVNAQVPIQADAIIGGSVNIGGGDGVAAHFDMGDGQTLTIKDNVVFTMNLTAATPGGIRGVSGGATENFIIADNAVVTAQFIVHFSVSMTGASQLILNGGGIPINFSTVDLAPDWTGNITFNAETVADATSEHLGKITVGGQAAVLGNNVQIVSDGGAGSILTVVPEPGSIALLGLGGLVLATRRRG